MDDGVKGADLVRGFGEGAGLGERGEVPDQHACCAGEGGAGLLGALGGAGVEVDCVARVDEAAGGEEAEAVGGAGDEDAGHDCDE